MKYLKNGGLFILLFIATFYFVLKDIDVNEMMSAIADANPWWVICGIMAMGLFLICEGVNIRRCLNMFNYEVPISQGIKYAIIGFFFSSITPSASGGQPMQLYYMHRDAIQVSHGTLALLFELLSFQTVTISIAIIGYFTQVDFIESAMGSTRWILLIGLAINLVVMIILCLAIFKETAITKMIYLLVKVIGLFSSKKAKLIEEKVYSQADEFKKSKKYFIEEKSIFFKTIMTTVIQMCAMYCVPYFVYRAFGLDTYSFIQIILIQSVLYVAVSALPLPGALGVTESGFMMLFRVLFPQAILGSAMVLSRGISFYLIVLVAGIIVTAITFLHQPKTKGANCC